jgi:hypothetical protein
MGIKLVCEKCGSEDVSRDASARWCETTQKWELSAVYDQAFCDACGECSLKEVPVNKS